MNANVVTREEFAVPKQQAVLTDCNMNVLDDSFQVFFKRPLLQLLDVALILLQRHRKIADRIWIRGSVVCAAGGLNPIHLSHKLLQIFKWVLPVHCPLLAGLLRLFLLIFRDEVVGARGRNQGVCAEALYTLGTTCCPDWSLRSLCVIQNMSPLT